MQQDLEPLVDPRALERYLRSRRGDMGGEGGGDALDAGSIEIERHIAGHSNETFVVRLGAGEWVLRRPPRGAFLPTAHDVGREYRVLSALAGTGVRVPRAILMCEDASVIGAPFYLMERVEGVVIRNTLPEAFVADVDSRGAIGEELVDALVELHAVDWRAVGLEGFGKPSGYLERQIRRWNGQLALTEPLTRPLPDLHRVGAWLEDRVPAGGDVTIVHGDYKLDNVVFQTEGPARLAAILDWEMSTLGDPLADVGWMASFWRDANDPEEFILDEQTVTRIPGFQPRDEVLARYGARSGRRIEDLAFYMALAVWKLAILLEGSYARYLAGVTEDPFFVRLEEGVPALATMALSLTRS
ncbi:MAG TPA: phosphotransferase family protein [Actinomycetota bacterium]|nr:phosphotransferase family protein [Actinomycetota bacterium]